MRRPGITNRAVLALDVAARIHTRRGFTTRRRATVTVAGTVTLEMAGAGAGAGAETAVDAKPVVLRQSLRIWI
jgi:hypothetical protein